MAGLPFSVPLRRTDYLQEYAPSPETCSAYNQCCYLGYCRNSVCCGILVHLWSNFNQCLWLLFRPIGHIANS
jgi:hypothetical protein